MRSVGVGVGKKFMKGGWWKLIVASGQGVSIKQDKFLLILVPHLAETEACRTGPWGPPGPLRTMAAGCSVRISGTLQRFSETPPNWRTAHLSHMIVYEPQKSK